VKRLTAWLGGVAGGMAAYRLFKRAPQPVPARAPEPDPADALRAKIAETKAQQEPAAPADPDERRRSVHERGRAAIDEMKGEQSS
jgi:hypothetical protein